MATLNAAEQAKAHRLAELEAHRRNGTLYVSEGQLKEARQLVEWAENNAEARERFQQQRRAEGDAEEAKRQAWRDAETLAAQDAYKGVAASTFPGTAAQFDAAWPDILKAWQIRNTAGDMGELLEQKRRQFGGML